MSVTAIANKVADGAPVQQYSGLFSACLSFDFGIATQFASPPQQYEFNTTDFYRAMDEYNAQQRAPREKVAEAALAHLWSTKESTKEWYSSKGVKLHSSPDTIQFVEYTAKGFVVHDDTRQSLTWLRFYLTRVASTAPSASSLSISSSSASPTVATVVFRPIILSSVVSAYYVCPVTLNISQEGWAACGYKVSDWFFKPLDISDQDQFIDTLRDPDSLDFSVPPVVATMSWQKLAWFWTEIGYVFGEPGARSSVLPAFGTPAVPLAPGGGLALNFSGNQGDVQFINGAVGQGAGSVNLSQPKTPGPSNMPFFNEQTAIEPKDKLIAAIGTAAAAAITIGVAAAVSG